MRSEIERVAWQLGIDPIAVEYENAAPVRGEAEVVCLGSDDAVRRTWSVEGTPDEMGANHGSWQSKNEFAPTMPRFDV